jgi:hypothetical protein
MKFKIRFIQIFNLSLEIEKLIYFTLFYYKYKD